MASRPTKLALARALKTLAADTPLNRIPIQAIAEECGVNRQTFYYHFHDIYALVEWIYADEASRALAGRKTSDTWQEGYRRIFQYVLDNRDFVLRTYHSLSREHLERYLHQAAYGLLIGVVEERTAALELASGPRGVSLENREFIAHFYKYSFAGLMLDWIGGGMEEEPQTLVDRVSTLLCGDIDKALKGFQGGA